MKYVITAATFLVTLAAMAAAVGLTVLAVAGPHSDTVPKSLQPLVFVVAWGLVLGVPTLAARAVWRRLGKRSEQVSQFTGG